MQSCNGKRPMVIWHAMIDQKEPQRAELLLVQCLVAAVFIGTFSHFGHYLLAVEGSGDNTNYIAIAKSIRHWNFAGVTPKLCWGTSYATAAFSGVFRTPERIFPAAALDDLLPGCALARATFGAVGSRHSSWT